MCRGVPPSPFYLSMQLRVDLLLVILQSNCWVPNSICIFVVLSENPISVNGENQIISHRLDIEGRTEECQQKFAELGPRFLCFIFPQPRKKVPTSSLKQPLGREWVKDIKRAMHTVVLGAFLKGQCRKLAALRFSSFLSALALPVPWI